MKKLYSLLLLCLLSASPAQALIAEACNGMSKHTILVMVTETDRNSHWDSSYVSLGWYRLEPGKCLPWDDLNGVIDEIYFYAKTEGGNYWEWAGLKGEYADSNCMSTGLAQFEYPFRVNDYDNIYSCDNATGYKRTLTKRVEPGGTVTFHEGNATREGAAAASPSTTPPPPGPTDQERADKAKADVKAMKAEIEELKKKEAKCEFGKISELLAKDITDMDPNFLRAMIACHDEFGKLADEVDAVTKAIADRLADAVKDIQVVLTKTQEALTAAGLAVADLYDSIGLAPVMGQAALALDDQSEEFYMWLTKEKYETEYLTGIIARSEYDSFLGLVHGWGDTYVGLGMSEGLVADTSFRQLNYLKSVKYFLDYFGRNKVQEPKSPVPAEVLAAIEADILPREEQAAKDLKAALRRWRGEKATVAQQLLLDTTVMVAGGYHNLTAATSTAAVKSRLKALVVDLTAASTDMANSNSFLARGDFLFGCEMGGGRLDCSDTGLAMNVYQRVSSSVELTRNSQAVQANFFQYLMGIPEAQRAQTLADATQNLELMKRVVILE